MYESYTDNFVAVRMDGHFIVTSCYSVIPLFRYSAIPLFRYSVIRVLKTPVLVCDSPDSLYNCLHICLFA